jgi:hypothetical protein
MPVLYQPTDAAKELAADVADMVSARLRAGQLLPSDVLMGLGLVYAGECLALGYSGPSAAEVVRACRDALEQTGVGGTRETGA